MAKVRLTVVHPADRSDNRLTSWRGEVKPHSGTDEMWSRLGAQREPSQLTLDVDSVPDGEHDFRVVWTDAFQQDTRSDVKTLEIKPEEPPIPLPLEAGSFTVERLPD